MGCCFPEELLYRETSGNVASGTDKIIVELEATWSTGMHCDRYADNLFLVLCRQ